MKVSRINEDANKIWNLFSSKASHDILQIEHDLYKKLLEFFQFGDSYYFVFNFQKNDIDFVSREAEKLLGYAVSEINIPFIIDKIHPEDAPQLIQFEEKALHFMASLPLDKLMKYKVSYDYRIRKKNGQYLRILQQAVIIQHDEAGRGLRSLSVHSDISYLKQDGQPVLNFVGMEGEPSYSVTDMNQQPAATENMLTNREKQVLKLLATGKHSQEVAQILKIGKQTVDTHRKNMIHKARLSNTNELIAKAIRFGWI